MSRPSVSLPAVSAKLAQRFGDRAQVYLALLGLALAIALLRWPIVAVDTDLWYHLNAGRFIAAAHELPRTAFFSFVRPEPAWLDYYWLAQLVFYGVHSAAGYAGLVVLRAALALGTAGLVLATLRSGREREGWGWPAFVFTVVVLFLLPRFAPVRPHDFSYLAIAAFVYLLESRRGLLALPALALLWVNLHGIEYPVLGLILGAYLGEWSLARLGLMPNVTPPAVRAFAAAVVALACVLVTPHGFGLVTAPLTPLTFASQYIEELKPVELSTLLSFRLDGLLVTRESLQTLVLVGGVVAALASLRRATLRPAHLVLFLGGFFLLTRIQRFSAEFVLLAVPLLAACDARRIAAQAPRALRVGAGVALAVLAFRHLYAAVELRCEWPLCTRQLAVGAAAFLSHEGAKGDVLNHPNDGGYLEWEIHPRQKIFADLQTPFLFSDRTIFVADQAFQDPTVLAALVAEYHPAFLLAPKVLRHFGSWIGRFPEYAPVFIDDTTVLYASAVSQAELVSRNRITAIDPFTLEVKGGAESLARAAEELARMNRIHAAAGRLRVFEGALALERGDAEAALRIADEVTAAQSSRPEGYRLRGDALASRERFADAALAYETALANSDDPANASHKFQLESRLWACYSRTGRKAEAYRALRAAVGDLYRAAVGYQDLASLAAAALDAGHEAEGKTLFEFALAKTPASDAQAREQIEARLRALRK